jgi:cell division protein FtsB
MAGRTTWTERDSGFVESVCDIVRDLRHGMTGYGMPITRVSVRIGDSQLGLVCSRSVHPFIDERVLEDVHRFSQELPHPIIKIAIVVPSQTSAVSHASKRKSLGVDVVARAELWQYLRDWAEVITAVDEYDARTATVVKSPIHSAPLRSNATAIITITRSLAIQIDAKLDALNREKPNSDHAIAVRDAALSEYQQLRARVTELEKAVAKLTQRNAKITPAAKAATGFSVTVEKWWTKSGPKVLDKSADMGIVVTCAGLLALMGANPLWAAAVSAYVVTGKAPKGLFKIGH